MLGIELEVELLPDGRTKELLGRVFLRPLPHDVRAWQDCTHRVDPLQVAELAGTGDVVAAELTEFVGLDDDNGGVEQRGFCSGKPVLHYLGHCGAVDGDDPSNGALPAWWADDRGESTGFLRVPHANGTPKLPNALVFFQSP